LLAHVLVAKYGDFLPLYRQAGIFARQGVDLDRSTLCDWVGRACWWLEPLWRLVRRHVMASTRIFADDTTLPVLDPGRGRTKTGRLWGYAIDDRPWGGTTPPAVVFLYAADRMAHGDPALWRGLFYLRGVLLDRNSRRDILIVTHELRPLLPCYGKGNKKAVNAQRARRLFSVPETHSWITCRF